MFDSIPRARQIIRQFLLRIMRIFFFFLNYSHLISLWLLLNVSFVRQPLQGPSSGLSTCTREAMTMWLCICKKRSRDWRSSSWREQSCKEQTITKRRGRRLQWRKISHRHQHENLMIGKKNDGVQNLQILFVAKALV